jgi:hypothetical protein
MLKRHSYALTNIADRCRASLHFPNFTINTNNGRHALSLTQTTARRRRWLQRCTATQALRIPNTSQRLTYIPHSRTTRSPLHPRRKRPLPLTTILQQHATLTLQLTLLIPPPLTLPGHHTPSAQTYPFKLQTHLNPPRPQKTNLNHPLLSRRPPHRLRLRRLYHQALERPHRTPRTYARRPPRRHIRTDMVARQPDPRVRQRRQIDSPMGYEQGTGASHATARPPQLRV